MELKEVVLNDLPREHEFRNTPFNKFKKAYFTNKGTKVKKQVLESFKISKCCFNELGNSWTDYDIWSVEV